MAGLPWIELHVALPEHPKSIRLGRLLKDRRAWTYYVQLLLWCAKNCPSGRVEGADALAVLEHASGWEGAEGAFGQAAVDVRLVDADETGASVHNWSEYAGAHVAKLARDAERQRDRRAKTSGKFATKKGRKKGVHATSDGRPADVAGDNNTNTNTNPLSSKEEEAVAPAVAVAAFETFAPAEAPAAPAPASPSRPRQKKLPRPDAPPPAGFREATGLLCAVFLECRGIAYDFQDGRDGKALAGMLRKHPIDEIESAWRKGLARTKYPTIASLHELQTHWNHAASGDPPVAAATSGIPVNHEGRKCAGCGRSSEAGGRVWGGVWLCYRECHGLASAAGALSSAEGVAGWIASHRAEVAA